jgi:hypothetical protein
MKVYPCNSAKQNDDDTVPNLYEIVYFYDSSVPDAKPVIKHAIMKKLGTEHKLRYMKLTNRQEKIVVSDEILKIIEEIKQNHMPVTTRISV